MSIVGICAIGWAEGFVMCFRRRVHRYGPLFLMLWIFVILFLWNCILSDTEWFAQENENPRSHVFDILSNLDLPRTRCITGAPCVYPDEHDLKIIVMSYNRANSLQKCLDHLQNITLDGDTGSVEIWIDRNRTGGIHWPTLKVARKFRWRHGPSRVHIQQSHAGIYGQWIDTWRPRPGSKELAIFLEDDIDVSPFIYRWTKAAHRNYGHLNHVAGYSHSEENLVNHRNRLVTLQNTSAFFFQRYGTFGFSPHPARWREFQDWFHIASLNKTYKPYVDRDSIFTKWYHQFEHLNKTDSMWSMWFIKFTDTRHLFTLFPNIKHYIKVKSNVSWANTSLAYHRREPGLHFIEVHRRNSSTAYLMSHWNDIYKQNQSKPPYLSYRGISCFANNTYDFKHLNTC